MGDRTLGAVPLYNRDHLIVSTPWRLPAKELGTPRTTLTISPITVIGGHGFSKGKGRGQGFPAPFLPLLDDIVKSQQTIQQILFFAPIAY